jgi:hypothetical protein
MASSNRVQLIIGLGRISDLETTHCWTYKGVNAIRDAFDAARMRIGDSADEILGRPAFPFGSSKTELDLVVLTAADLGFAPGSVTVAEIYRRALQLGLELCPAEVGPQLRLEYVNQPVGEFLHIAMRPVATYLGDLVDLTVANGGAGLLLLGGDASPDIKLHSSVKFVLFAPLELRCPTPDKKSPMPRKLKLALVALSAAALASWVQAAPAHADAISDWNAKAEALATEKRSSTLSRAQSLAILHVAMFEAINALELQNDVEKPDTSADQNTAVDAAAAVGRAFCSNDPLSRVRDRSQLGPCDLACQARERHAEGEGLSGRQEGRSGSSRTVGRRETNIGSAPILEELTATLTEEAWPRNASSAAAHRLSVGRGRAIPLPAFVTWPEVITECAADTSTE